MISKEQLILDLSAVESESYRDCASRLYSLGYRMPDCAERWQRDRLLGAVFGAGRLGLTLEQMAEALVDTAGLTRPGPGAHRKESP